MLSPAGRDGTSDRTAGTAPPTDAVHPAFAFRDTDLWLQGINLGLAMRW